MVILYFYFVILVSFLLVIQKCFNDWSYQFFPIFPINFPFPLVVSSVFCLLWWPLFKYRKWIISPFIHSNCLNPSIYFCLTCLTPKLQINPFLSVNSNSESWANYYMALNSSIFRALKFTLNYCIKSPFKNGWSLMFIWISLWTQLSYICTSVSF